MKSFYFKNYQFYLSESKFVENKLFNSTKNSELIITDSIRYKKFLSKNNIYALIKVQINNDYKFHFIEFNEIEFKIERFKSKYTEKIKISKFIKNKASYNNNINLNVTINRLLEYSDENYTSFLYKSETIEFESLVYINYDLDKVIEKYKELIIFK